MPRRYVEAASVIRSLGRALDTGRVQPLGASYHKRTARVHSWRADYSGNCWDPVHIFRDGARLTKEGKSHVFGRWMEPTQHSELIVRCRQCEPCLAARAAHWRHRATSELHSAVRTWFGTLTLSPAEHYKAWLRAVHETSKQGDDLEALSEEARFAARHRQINQELTRYVKRLRDATGPHSLTFLCVLEAHESGMPHYHMLVHERDPARPVRHSVLKQKWRLGFSRWKLVDGTPRSAYYTTKYLAKSSLARVRASIDYGNHTSVPTGPSTFTVRDTGAVTDKAETELQSTWLMSALSSHMEAPYGIP